LGRNRFGGSNNNVTKGKIVKIYLTLEARIGEFLAVCDIAAEYDSDMKTSMRDILHIGLLCFILIGTAQAQQAAQSKIAYWDTQRRGANWFNVEPTRQWLVDAKSAGIEFVRMVPNKWHTAGRDSLLGNADDYVALVDEDLRMLMRTLSEADSVGVKLVVSTLSLPGCRWKQQNGDSLDLRLWRDVRYHEQAANFWRELASHLRGFSCVVGYNILNEPVPERAESATRPSSEAESGKRNRLRDPADLNRFYRTVIAAIREVDSLTPIVLDCGQWAAPGAMAKLEPVADDKVIYSFHMYEPWEYTNRKENGGRFEYPGDYVLTSVSDERDTIRLSLSPQALREIIQPVIDWQAKYHVPSNRIFAGEFGCNRMNKGAAMYLGDLISIFNEHQWHWAFYSFREDEWDGMDYELGDRPLGWRYWQAKERGETPPLPRTDNPMWRVMEEGVRGKSRKEQVSSFR
jgi:hypothetical protein